MRGTPDFDFNRAKAQWVAFQIAAARLRGEPIDVITLDGKFRFYPDGSTRKLPFRSKED